MLATGAKKKKRGKSQICEDTFEQYIVDAVHDDHVIATPNTSYAFALSDLILSGQKIMFQDIVMPKKDGLLTCSAKCICLDG